MKARFDAPKILEEFPERVITLPISENGNSDFAVGLSIAGLVPIVDVISSDFLFRTMDSICNTMAKQASVAEPRTIVVRAEFLTGGPTTGQRIESLFAHVPGLRVGVPSTSTDAYSMMRDSLKHKGVTLLFEDRMIPDESPEPYRPLGMCHSSGARASFRKRGTTIISYGLTYRRLESECTDGALVDLRWLYPLDMDVVLGCTRESEHLLIVEPCPSFLGIGAELAAQVAEAMPGVRIKRLGAKRCTIPVSKELQEQLLPTREDIEAALKELAA